MHVTNLRKVGGSVMLTVPPAVLEELHLKVGAEVELKVSENTLVVKPRKRKKYTMKELLDQCDFSLPISEEEQEWLDLRPVGGELL